LIFNLNYFPLVTYYKTCDDSVAESPVLDAIFGTIVFQLAGE
jgi:hypothetical protein